MSLVKNFREIRIWQASKLLLHYCNDMILTGFRKKSVHKGSVKYGVCEGEIKYDIMCLGNRSTINLYVYEKISQ